jgi:diguanylate cyclase (GGDEF)-like protein/excisionase family DNA binding protein
VANEHLSAATSSAFSEALRALAPAIQADAERYRPDDHEDAAGWRLAMGACAKMQAALAGSTPVEIDGRMGELLAISPGRVPVTVLFEAAGTVERAILDELAPDPDLGATSSAWPYIAQRVRRATLTMLARFTDAVNSSPELFYDQTTTLLTRRLLELVLPHEIARAERHGRPLAVLLIAIDRLAALDQRLGTGTSERVLERVGILTRRYFRVHDWLTRFDASSVCAVLPDTDPEVAAVLAERFRTIVRERFVLEDYRDGTRIPVTLTVAVIAAAVVPPGVGAEDVLKEALQAVTRGVMDGGDRSVLGAIKSEETSIASAADALGTSTLTIRRMIREGRLTPTRRGRHTYVSLAAVERLRRN